MRFDLTKSNVYTLSDGTKYEGEFKDGNYHGQGTYNYASGHQYIGEYKDGKKQLLSTGRETLHGCVFMGVWPRDPRVRPSTYRIDPRYIRGLDPIPIDHRYRYHTQNVPRSWVVIDEGGSSSVSS